MFYSGYYFSEYTVAMLFTLAMALTVVFMLWKRRASKGAIFIMLIEIVVIEWAITGALKAAATTVAAKYFWVSCTYLAVTTTPPLFFLFALSFSNMERFISTRNVILLFLIPAATILLAFTNSFHQLIWTGIHVNPVNYSVSFQYGPFFWVLLVYVYLIMSSGILLVFYSFYQYSQYYRHQVLLISMAALAPLAGNIIYIFHLSPIKGVDWTPVGVGLSGFLLAVGLYRYKLFDLIPVARTTLMETMGDGIMVIDPLHRLVDINTAMKDMIGDSVILKPGVPINDALIGWPALLHCIENGGQGQHREVPAWEQNTNGFFDVKITGLFDKKNAYSGSIIVLRDISERKRLEEEHRELIGELGAALQHVKTLHGLLPICANCKKIRDDGGYWHAVETYVRDHSNADFSHCFCPDCLEKLYPEFTERDNKSGD